MCSYRVRRVDGSCAEHSTVKSYTVFICQVILIWYSITHSLFYSRLKTFLFCKSFPLQPFLFVLQDSLHGFPRLFTVIYEHICFLLLVFLCECRFVARRWTAGVSRSASAAVSIKQSVILRSTECLVPALTIAPRSVSLSDYLTKSVSK